MDKDIQEYSFLNRWFIFKRKGTGELAVEADQAEAQLAEEFVEDADTRRTLIELGLRGSGATLKRAEFEARKQADRERNLHKEVAARALASAGADVGDKPLLAALAAREELVRSGKLSTILFLRTTNKAGQEVSGYIDYAHRLQTDAWEPVFRGAAAIGACALLPFAFSPFFSLSLSFFTLASAGSVRAAPLRPFLLQLGHGRVVHQRLAKLFRGCGGGHCWAFLQGEARPQDAARGPAKAARRRQRAHRGGGRQGLFASGAV